MSNINIGTIRTNLKGVLQNLVTNTVVAVVYDYYEPDVSGYPAIVFDITDNKDSFLTNQENLLKMTFTAYILVEIISKNISQATSILDTVTDEAIELLVAESNLSLGGTVDWISPVIGPRTQIETPNGQAFMQELNIELNISRTI